MQRKSKLNYKEWLYIIVAWIILYYLYLISAFWGMSDFLKEGLIKEYLGTPYIHLEIIMGAVLFGLLFNFINVVTDKTAIRRKSFGYIIFIKSLLYIFMMLIVFLIVYGIFYIFEIGPFKNPDSMVELLSMRFLLSWLVYFFFSILLINFIIQVNRKFGPGNLFKLITGKYHKPGEESRIFLFLDLKGSTTIAEKLGHTTYSQLLRNCFHDLTDIVIKYKADIYQYIGDEVVLSWKIKDGFQTLNCIKLYFAYENKLKEHKEFYMKHYHNLPEFKGGMDMGVVTVAEIGDIKREIAYHGDVLNTASRIQKQCNVLDKNLLISENLEEELIDLNGFEKEFIGEVNLRGKEKNVKLYSLSQSNKLN
jgi:adenylate cyclase